MSDEGFSFRWGIPVLDEGVVTVPNYFFDYYHRAGIQREEFLLILHLARYHYETPAGEARPSLTTVAKQMGYSKRTILRKLERLELGGMLRIERRPGKPSVYDVQPFSERMENLLRADRSGDVAESPVTPTAPLPVTSASPPTSDKAVSPKEENRKNKSRESFVD